MSFFSISKTLTLAAMVATSWFVTQSGQAAHAFSFSSGGIGQAGFSTPSFGGGTNFAQSISSPGNDFDFFSSFLGSDDFDAVTGDGAGFSPFLLLFLLFFLLGNGNSNANAADLPSFDEILAKINPPPVVSPDGPKKDLPPAPTPVPTPLLVPGLVAFCLGIGARRKGKVVEQSA
jgi:hypothetical protein